MSQAEPQMSATAPTRTPGSDHTETGQGANVRPGGRATDDPMSETETRDALAGWAGDAFTAGVETIARLAAERDEARADAARLRGVVEALRSAVERIERLAKGAAIEAHTRMWPVVERDWLDALAIIERIPAPVSSSGEGRTVTTVDGLVTCFAARSDAEAVAYRAGWADALADERDRAVSSSGEAESGAVGVWDVCPRAFEHDRVTFCGSCGYRAPIAAPAPVPSGGQADGAAVDALTGIINARWGTDAVHRLIAQTIVDAGWAARPVLSREALVRLLGEHYATGLAAERTPHSPWKVECACGTVIGDTTDGDIEDRHIRHLADVLDGGRS